MAEAKSRLRWLLLLLALAAGTIIGRTILRPDPPEPVYLPGKTTVEVVESPETLQQLASLSAINSDLTLENGVLKDENGRLVEVVAQLSVDTGPVEPPEPTVIERFIERECPGVVLPKFQYRARMEAWRFKGYSTEGDFSYGWRGELGCQVSTDGDTWDTLVLQPFNLSAVEARSSVRPEPSKRPIRWYTGIQYALLTSGQSESVRFDDYTQFVSIQPNRIRIYGGRQFGRRIGLGIFYDQHATGVDLRYAF